jgi:hypothetical protein
VISSSSSSLYSSRRASASNWSFFPPVSLYISSLPHFISRFLVSPLTTSDHLDFRLPTFLFHVIFACRSLLGVCCSALRCTRAYYSQPMSVLVHYAAYIVHSLRICLPACPSSCVGLYIFRIDCLSKHFQILYIRQVASRLMERYSELSSSSGVNFHGRACDAV